MSAGVLFLLGLSVRPLRTNCWMVGTCWYLFPFRGARPCWTHAISLSTSLAATPPRRHRTTVHPVPEWASPCELRTCPKLLATFRCRAQPPGYAHGAGHAGHDEPLYLLTIYWSKLGCRGWLPPARPHPRPSAVRVRDLDARPRSRERITKSDADWAGSPDSPGRAVRTGGRRAGPRCPTAPPTSPPT